VMCVQYYRQHRWQLMLSSFWHREHEWRGRLNFCNVL